MVEKNKNQKINDDKYEKIMDKIMNNKEKTPSIDDNKWKKINNYYIIDDYEPIEYTIDNRLINDMNKYNELYIKMDGKYRIKKEKQTGIIKLYMIYKEDESIYSINTTSGSIIRAIKLNLSKSLRGGTSNLNIFINDLENVKIKSLVFIKGLNSITNKKELGEIKKHYEKQFVNKTNNKKTVDECYLVVEKIISNIERKCKKNNIITSVIYQITKNNKKYIGLSFNDITDEDIFNLNKKQLLIKNKSDISIKKLEIIKDDLHIIGMIKADKYIIQNDTIKNGLNKNYYMGNIYSKCNTNTEISHLKNNLFLKIQKELFDNNYEDNINYDKLTGYIYMIENKINNKKYISFVNRDENNHMITLKEIMLDLYNDSISKKKNSKITTALKYDTYDNFNICILKERNSRSRYNVKAKVEENIIKYDSINNGYNDNENRIRGNMIRNFLNKK